MSNAKFTGARLSDVLRYAGLNEDTADAVNAQHVQFYGADKPYDASISVDKAISHYGDTLLA